MRSQNYISRELEGSILSILTIKEPTLKLNICCESEMDDFFKLEREGVCRYYLNNECKKGDHCEFRHEEDITKNAKYKTKLCKNYMETGVCKYKDQCSYAHGPKELKGSTRQYD